MSVILESGKHVLSQLLLSVKKTLFGTKNVWPDFPSPLSKTSCLRCCYFVSSTAFWVGLGVNSGKCAKFETFETCSAPKELRHVWCSTSPTSLMMCYESKWTMAVWCCNSTLALVVTTCWSLVHVWTQNTVTSVSAFSVRWQWHTRLKLLSGGLAASG